MPFLNIIKISEKLGMFWMLKVLEKKFNVEYNKQDEMRNKNNIILLDLQIFYKLFKSFIFIISISHSYKSRINRKNEKKAKR